jgi:hypothetical protein
LAKLTTHNFFEPLQTIIPWASNLYTETLIERTKERFGEDFLGFWMLGGCSGGGMGFIFKPEAKARAVDGMQEIMLTTKREMEHALPFAMDPVSICYEIFSDTFINVKLSANSVVFDLQYDSQVVYDFSINNHGTIAKFCEKSPTLSDKLTSDATVSSVLDSEEKYLDELLEELGFDSDEHECTRLSYKSGEIGLKQNRLSLASEILNVLPEDVIISEDAISEATRAVGMKELEKGSVAVVTLAAGVGSRWTHGAGCVKAIHPFCKLGGKHRSFLEIHLAKSKRISNLTGTSLPHILTTSHMTDGPLRTYLKRSSNHDYTGPLYQSQGKAIGLRLIPTVSDLKFAWEEKQQQKLDEQAQKVKESANRALIRWAQSRGEASDYKDNIPLQCLHPVGHYWEFPNLLLNGTLRQMLEDRPQLKYLMLHNIDTVGTDVDPGMLGLFVEGKSTISFEVIPREIEDIGGGLARVNGKTRLVEGLSLPREEDEFKFSFYNTLTCWINIDKLLSKFGLSRDVLHDSDTVSVAVKTFSQRLPTYAAIKEVKKRWGNGQEDVFPTAQFEKLWGDMSSLDDMDCDFVVVPRVRGAQLKNQAQLDGWLRDGSASFLESICAFQES